MFGHVRGGHDGDSLHQMRGRNVAAIASPSHGAACMRRSHVGSDDVLNEQYHFRFDSVKQCVRVRGRSVLVRRAFDRRARCVKRELRGRLNILILTERAPMKLTLLAVRHSVRNVKTRMMTARGGNQQYR